MRLNVILLLIILLCYDIKVVISADKDNDKNKGKIPPPALSIPPTSTTPSYTTPSKTPTSTTHPKTPSSTFDSTEKSKGPHSKPKSKSHKKSVESSGTPREKETKRNSSLGDYTLPLVDDINDFTIPKPLRDHTKTPSTFVNSPSSGSGKEPPSSETNGWSAYNSDFTPSSFEPPIPMSQKKDLDDKSKESSKSKKRSGKKNGKVQSTDNFLKKWNIPKASSFSKHKNYVTLDQSPPKTRTPSPEGLTTPDSITRNLETPEHPIRTLSTIVVPTTQNQDPEATTSS